MPILKKIAGKDVKIKTEQITDFLTPKYLITGLNIGAGETVTTYKNELVKAKLVVFFLRTAGSQYNQGFYMRSMTTAYNKYYLGNSSNPKFGIYISVSNDGTLNVSEYEYDGYTKIIGFATFY